MGPPLRTEARCDAPLDLLLDANSVIDLVGLGCFERVLQTPSHRFFVVENVMGEILDPAQRQAVQAAIDANLLAVVRVEAPHEIELYAEMRRVLGDGEAASLAIAEHRRWGFVSYEGRRLAREAMARIGATYFLRTPEVLARAVHAGLIDLDALRVAITHTNESQAGNPPGTSVEHLTTLVDQAQHLIHSPP